MAFNLWVGALRGSKRGRLRAPMMTADVLSPFCLPSPVSPFTSVILLNASNHPMGKKEDYVEEGFD